MSGEGATIERVDLTETDSGKNIPEALGNLAIGRGQEYVHVVARGSNLPNSHVGPGQLIIKEFAPKFDVATIPIEPTQIIGS